MKNLPSMSEPRLYSYKMTADTGFAPNPFWGVLTLATCKPDMRQSKRPGDWIAGFTSASLCGDSVGDERLVYLMRVDEKLPVAQYYTDARFRSKVPDTDADAHVRKVGDNIYRPICAEPTGPRDFKQLRNSFHWDGASSCGPKRSRDHDLSGGFVLTAKEFAYFGSSALPIPGSIRPDVPHGQSRYGAKTRDSERIMRFVEYVFDSAAGRGIVASPHDWPDDDKTWRQ